MTTDTARPIHPGRAATRRYTHLGAAALAVGGLTWLFKAGAILLTGWQPPQALEVGQALCALGVLLLGVGLRPLANRLGIWAAVLGALALAARLAASVYELWPGAVVATGGDFVVPYSPLVLVASVGGLLGLALLSAAWWRPSEAGSHRRAVPLAAALAPLPATLTALLHIEWPILIIGAAWIAAAVAFWRDVPSDRLGPKKGSA